MANKAQNQPKVSSASEFRKRGEKYQAGEIIELSTGLVVKARRPSITLMVRSGAIPSSLAASSLKYDSGRQISDRDVQRLFELKELVVSLALVEPRIVKEPNYDAGEIAVTDLVEDEINDVYAYVQGGPAVLESFREERQAILDRQNSEEVSRD